MCEIGGMWWTGFISSKVRVRLLSCAPQRSVSGLFRSKQSACPFICPKSMDFEHIKGPFWLLTNAHLQSQNAVRTSCCCTGTGSTQREPMYPVQYLLTHKKPEITWWYRTLFRQRWQSLLLCLQEATYGKSFVLDRLIRFV